MADLTEVSGVIDPDLAHEIAAAMIARRIVRGWSRQTILASVETGPTICGRAFYLMRGGVIAVALFPLSQLSDMNGRGNWFSIRDLLPALPTHTHASTEELQPFQIGDKVWSWYKDEPNANYGLPDLPGDASNWRRRPRLFTVRSVSGPRTERGFCAGRPHYAVKLRYQEGPSADHYNAGSYALCPITGRPWQMRAGGEYLELAQHAAHAAKQRRATPAPAASRPPALPAQLDLFA